MYVFFRCSKCILRTHSAAEVSTMRFPNGVLSVCPELYIFGDIADLGPWKEDHGSQSVLWPRRRSQSQCICEHHKAFQIWAIWAWCHFQIAVGWWRTQSHDGNRHLETPGARNAPSVLTPAMASRISHETVRVEHSMHACIYIYYIYTHDILCYIYIYIYYIKYYYILNIIYITLYYIIYIYTYI